MTLPSLLDNVGCLFIPIFINIVAGIHETKAFISTSLSHE